MREDRKNEKRLIAYVVANQASLAVNDLRVYLRHMLPSYMLPESFVLLESLPLSSNGKLDRQALPIPEDAGAGYSGDFVVPPTPTEEKIVAIWVEILKREKVSVHDNFFFLGGHSLLATQIISRINDAFHIQLPLRKLFEEPTPAGIAEIIGQMEKENAYELQEQSIMPVPREAHRVNLPSLKRRM